MNRKKFLSFGLVVVFLALSQSSNSQNIGLVNIKYADQTITVGGPGADVQGFTSHAIQIAIDAMKVRGGGTVKLIRATMT